MMIKKYFNLSLMAALLCSLSLGVVSCKDDDNNDNGNRPQSEQSEVEGLSTLADDQLQNLLERWTDADADSFAVTNWQAKRYAATVGEVYPGSPTVRYVVVGSLEAADRYAVDCLAPLGINPNKPDGFTFTDDQVGTVAYNHGNGGESLATITVDVPQIGGLTAIRLLATAPENATYDPYYSLGDIIQYKDLHYVCVSKHKGGGEARFITINNEHSVGSCHWLGKGYDYVYNDAMAKAEVLSDWLTNIVLDYDMWEKVKENMVEHALRSEEQLKQLIPVGEKTRATLINTLAYDQSYITDLLEQDNFMGYNRWNASMFPWQEEGNGIMRYALHGYLLADKMRYTITRKYWVPYIYMVSKDDADALEEAIAALPSHSQTTLSPSHFTYRRLSEQANVAKELTETDVYGNVDNMLKQGVYYTYVIAMYWEHKTHRHVMDNEQAALWDFTKDWQKHPDEFNRQDAQKYPDDLTNACITSSSITFTDNGSKNTKYKDVYVDRNWQD